MMKKIIVIFGVIALTLACLIFNVNASNNGKLIEKNGKIYYVNGEKYITGWNKINDNLYYFKKSGEAVTGSVTIGGIRYKFNSDGICEGKYTGWTRAGNKRFYYVDGVKRTGWLWIYNSGWYYFDEISKERVTGAVIIDGKEQTFSANGVWEGENKVDVSVLSSEIEKKLSKDDYGGVYIDEGVLVVLYTNENNVKNYTDSLKDKRPQIDIKPCKFSKRELESVKKYLDKNMEKLNILGLYTDVVNNRIVVEMKESNNQLNKYIKSLDNSDIIYIVYGDYELIND